VYTTSIYTVTSCAPTITNCPVGHVTTEIISLYTTVCPVAESTPVTVSLPPFTKPTSLPAGENTSTTTRSSTFTSYVTVKMIKSTATVVPTPMYPTLAKQYSAAAGSGTGAGVPAPQPTSVAGGEVTPSASAPETFTGAGNKMGGSMGVVAAIFVGAVAMVL
jgi:chitinase